MFSGFFMLSVLLDRYNPGFRWCGIMAIRFHIRKKQVAIKRSLVCESVVLIFADWLPRNASRGVRVCSLRPGRSARDSFLDERIHVYGAVPCLPFRPHFYICHKRKAAARHQQNRGMSEGMKLIQSVELLRFTRGLRLL